MVKSPSPRAKSAASTEQRKAAAAMWFLNILRFYAPGSRRTRQFSEPKSGPQKSAFFHISQMACIHLDTKLKVLEQGAFCAENVAAQDVAKIIARGVAC